jgi:hypothetical protein
MRFALTKVLIAALTMPTSALSGIAKDQGTLPDGAIALTPAETTAVYVGHTTRYDAPDAVVRNTWRAGKALAVWEGKNGHVSPADGTWTVSGNQFCYDQSRSRVRRNNGDGRRQDLHSG